MFEREIGYVSAMKMCRSVMIKGIESLMIEAMTASVAYDVVDQVIPSLDEYFKGKDWRWQAEYMFGRVVEHGERRAAEMREAAKTVAEIGLEPLMTAATAERQQWVADRIPRDKFKGEKPTLDDYAAAVRAVLDRERALARAARLPACHVVEELADDAAAEHQDDEDEDHADHDRHRNADAGEVFVHRHGDDGADHRPHQRAEAAQQHHQHHRRRGGEIDVGQRGEAERDRLQRAGDARRAPPTGRN